jgi:hypothetical protein
MQNNKKTFEKRKFIFHVGVLEEVDLRSSGIFVDCTYSNYTASHARPKSKYLGPLQCSASFYSRYSRQKIKARARFTLPPYFGPS